MSSIAWDRPKLTRLKHAIAKAKRNRLEVFTFEDHEYLVAYAKYLIDYLDRVLPKGR